MPTSYHQDRTFTGTELSADQLANAEFEACTFRQCAWGGVLPSNTRFTDCAFEQCDLNTALTKNTAFRTVRFEGCKLLGLQLDQCSAFLFAMGFDQCRLGFAVFRSAVLKKTSLNGCRLHEVDFSGADLWERRWRTATCWMPCSTTPTWRRRTCARPTTSVSTPSRTG